MNHAFIKRVLQYVYGNTVERIKIGLLDFKSNPPIIIYQMGKVGSSTISKSLKKAKLSNSVFHVHFLTQSGIEDAEKFHVINNVKLIPHHLRLSKMLRKKLESSRDMPLKIITLVREPISIAISTFFQNIQWFNKDFAHMNDQVDNERVTRFLESKTINYDPATDYIETWFDKEIKAVTNIDVYKYPFDHNKGFSIIKKENVDLLIMRLEDLNRNFNQALTDFLDLKHEIAMFKTNIREDKEYASAYKYVKRNIVIPESVCRKIYYSRFSTHFYNEQMRETFIKRWAGSKK